ncbi:UNVERIFIED_CONTAM: hypothetical protein RMT77_009188 [Armadillidium vulgare]
MENILEYRDRVGVPDAILLEDFESEDAFIENLRKRYCENQIYTYIGQVLVSLNPYKDLQIYTDLYFEKYRKVNFYEVPPHVYAIAENAYRSMTAENCDHCILISGESGSGKTEASKHVLHFIAASSEHHRDIDTIRDKLVNSNPLLEAFGNAKTSRNDNSSRFGKYMDIECDFKGDPIGGHVINYLLEKSRVVHQEKGERNFHIFYQLLAGLENDILSKLSLKRDPNNYHYLRQGLNGNGDTINDKAKYNAVQKAMAVIDFSKGMQNDIWQIVAAILHIGNVTFREDESGHACIDALDEAGLAAKLLECDKEEFLKAMTHRTIEAREDVVLTPLSVELAVYARDALSKSVYERLFKWLVEKLNKSLEKKEILRSNLMGILDIYGFEIFDNNGFEQFCINYCNEKLQQIFIELTLRSEQEEYNREGIKWERVDYFDNKIICDLVEEKHKGIISILDEECLRPGDASDATFLEKMDSLLHEHNHYFSYHTARNQTVKRKIRFDEFRLRHYAGDVSYCIKGFMDKNNDLLYRDLKTALSKSRNTTVSELYPQQELVNLKRPETAGSQFKKSLSQLMGILMSKEPSYIRCIKPNDEKRANDFNMERVRHQVKYLGLMENLRVRRAGFAYRRKYEIFLQRYKSLCPSTWPHFDGPPKDGVQIIVNHLKYSPEEYRMGRTKIFIRLPRTLFRTEDAFQRRKHELASMIQAIWKGKLQRRIYLKMLEASVTISKNWRRVLAVKQKAKRKWAAIVVRKFIHGFITRDDPLTPENKRFQMMVKINWLNRLAQNLPQSFMHHSWPDSPKSCEEASKILKDLHLKYLVGKYVKSMSPETKLKFEEKIEAETLFKGKKSSYNLSFPHWFMTSRVSAHEESMVKLFFENIPGEKIKYCSPCTKFNRHGYKEKQRIFVITTKSVYLLQDKEKLKAKESYHLNQISRLVVSPNNDPFLMIKIDVKNVKKEKGDLILSISNVIEVVTKIVIQSGKPELLFIMDSTTISHTMKKGKEGTIVLKQGVVPYMNKNKEGKLVVTSGP